jgi:hypothetical protein
MKNKINQKTTSIIAITFLAAICLVSIPSDVSGFKQSDGITDYTLHPGESETYNWKIYSSDGESGNIPIRVGGVNGTEFVSTLQSLDLEENSTFTIPITVTIPEDYPQEPHYYPNGLSFAPYVVATLEGNTELANGVIFNVAVMKMFQITVLPLYCGQHETYYDNIIVGTDSSDYLKGTSGSDLIFGEGGNDLIDGKGGMDCIYAGDGNDFINSGAGNDIIYAGNGDDTIRMSAGTNTVFGEEGNDILYAANKKGSNIMDGGDGLDVCAAKSKNSIASITNCEVTE